MEDMQRLERVSTTELAEDHYFEVNAPPRTLQEHSELAAAFIAHHHTVRRRVVLITSGGTTVPLENQTVRFIDNFSAGTRGATSAEYFLQQGYAVIFLHRQFSLLPYSRHYSHSTNCFLDFMIEGDNGEVVVSHEYQREMKSVLREYTAAKENNMLLVLPFVTITDYLWALRDVAKLMRPLGSSALFYLAAAVSDFFVPKDRMAEHKIQSSEVGTPATNGEHATTNGISSSSHHSKKLVIDLDPVPKFLKRLVDGWAPDGMIVSFKLETDPSLLISKAETALHRYSHHLVIGNLLSTRKWEVVFVAPGVRERWIRVPSHRRVKSMSSPSNSVGNALAAAVANGQNESSMPNAMPIEIESIIVPEVAKLHSNHMNSPEPV